MSPVFAWVEAMTERLCASVVVFVACVVVDVLYVSWTRAAVDAAPWRAAALSAVIQLVALGQILLVIDARWLVVPNVMGHAVGSWVGVRRRR